MGLPQTHPQKTPPLNQRRRLMRKSALTLLLAASFFTLTAASAIVHARDSDGSSGSMMGHGMMGRGMMGGGDMMGMSRMMGHCGDMMRGSGRPNEQWRGGRSPAPDDHR
jgi:hypothetical protein